MTFAVMQGGEPMADVITYEQITERIKDDVDWIAENAYARGYNTAKAEIALSGEYERAYQRGKTDAQRWIPCSERLPDKPIRVQAQLDNWWIVTAYYDNAWHTVPDIGQELKNDEVIAWMPLPEQWRGGE